MRGWVGGLSLPRLGTDTQLTGPTQAAATAQDVQRHAQGDGGEGEEERVHDAYRYGCERLFENAALSTNAKPAVAREGELLFSRCRATCCTPHPALRSTWPPGGCAAPLSWPMP